MRIGHITLANRLFAAPMAGVTDRPFRQLCKRLGAGYAVSEMVTSRKDLWSTLKTSRRADHDGETAPIAVQIAGTDAAMMAEAAAYNVARGAQIIDINMGCPAKKVCNQWAGSALMKDEPLALAIVEAVVAECAPHGVPVTLKMRTGWCASEKNAVRIARAAESAGVAMVAVHGRTREQGYKGERRVRHRRGGQARGLDPGRRQRRHRLAREGARSVRRDRRRRDHDRPRRPGPALAVRRDRAPPGDRRDRAAAARERRQDLAARAPRRPLPPLRRVRRRAQREEAHRLDLARPARRRGISRRDERDRSVRRAGARGRRVVRPARRRHAADAGVRRRRHPTSAIH